MDSACNSSGSEMIEENSFGSAEASSSCFSSGEDLPSSEGYNTDSAHSYTHTSPTMLHWFRTSSLRLHDNPAFNYAMAEPSTKFRGVFIIDPWFADGKRKFGVNRWRFLLESLQDLDKRLQSFNSRLYVAQGQPVAVLEKLCTEWNVTGLTYQIDSEPHSAELEKAVDKMASTLDIKVSKFSSHTLYNFDKVQLASEQRPITTMKEFKALLPLLGPPELPISSPDMAATKLLMYDDNLESEGYRIPTLEELGFYGESLYTNDWIGGESEALRRLPIYCQLRCQPSTNQVDVLFDKTSLSPYIRFGCLSVRYFLWKVKWYGKSNPVMEPVVKDVMIKLLQREFYMLVAHQVPNFDVCSKNPICLQMPWEADDNLFRIWKEGRTGYPWIDAAMRQLVKEGWIHHYLRESVATFLTRGDLWINWVSGKDVFEELMLDFEPSVSCGCWMRSSGSAFITGPMEHYCPVTYGKKIDPHGQFIRAYLPELRKFPVEYIYCPWMAPPEVQEQCGCRIGIDYPHPIVDHATAGALCCERLRSVMQMVQRASTVDMSKGKLRHQSSSSTKTDEKEHCS